MTKQEAEDKILRISQHGLNHKLYPEPFPSVLESLQGWFSTKAELDSVKYLLEKSIELGYRMALWDIINKTDSINESD